MYTRFPLSTRTLPVLLATAMLASLLVPVDPARARLDLRCPYGAVGNRCSIKACRPRCQGSAKVFAKCLRSNAVHLRLLCVRTRKVLLSECGNAKCRNDVRRGFAKCLGLIGKRARVEGRDQRRAVADCRRCCSRSSDDRRCDGYLRQSRFYGSTRAGYGAVDCQGSIFGSASGAFLGGVSDAIRHRLATLVPALVEGW